MADLLAQWLNEEVGLSKPVTNFEEDFASGYLFGELLYKFNQQSDFHNFSTKNATSHFVMNFEKLEPTLRSLGVQFNSKTVEQIMKAERGQALRLLYQLKMVLEKVYPPADISIVAKTGTFGDNQPAQRIAFSKPKYDEVSHTFFKQRLGKLNRAQKEIDLEQHLMPFTDEMNRQAQQASKLDHQDKVNDAHQKQEMRRIQINKLQRNAGFMEEWLAKGVEDWKTNMSIKREREAAQLEFDFTQAEKYNELTKTKLNEAQEEVQLGIENFEKNLRSQGISTKVDKDQADKMIKDTLEGRGWEATQSPQRTMQGQTKLTFTQTFDAKASTKKGNFTLTSTGLKHRTKKTVTDHQRKEREKRRRRLINQQAQLFDNLECATRQHNAQDLMRRQSKQEKELDYEAWRTTQCKTIIVENRKLREQQYETRRKYDTELSLEKEQRLIQEMQDASQREIDQMCLRAQELKQYEQEFKKKQRTELCGSLLAKICDIADEAYQHMQDLDSKDWDGRNWNEWLKLFVDKQQVAGTMSELLSTTEEESSAAQHALDDAELRDYLNNEGQWPTTLVSENKLNLNDVMNPKVEAAAPAGKGKPAGKAPAQAEVVLDEADLELPDAAQNNHIFGDVVDQLIKLYYPPRPDLKHPPTPNYLALKVCLTGYPFAGKKTQAELIKQKYGLNVFVMEELINEAMTYNPDEHKSGQTADAEEIPEYEGLSEDEPVEGCPHQQYAQIGAEIKQRLLDGEEISDQQYVQLFVAKLRCTYPYKTPAQKRFEVEKKAQKFVQITRRLQEIDAEKQKEDLPKKTKKTLQTEEEQLQKDLAEIEKLPTDGWVLVDFPCSYAQAKLLEQALSGYVPSEELEMTDRDKEIKEALLLVEPKPEEDAQKLLIKSGLDSVIWLDLPVQESLRRSDGRRFDSANPDEHYHVFDNLPPCDQAPLCERLLPLSEDNNLVSGLPDRFIAFDQNKNALNRWLSNFGDEHRQRSLLSVFDAKQETQSIAQKISARLDVILEHREERFIELRDMLCSKIADQLEAQRAEGEEHGSQQLTHRSLSQNHSKSMLNDSQLKKSDNAAPTSEASPRQPQFARNNIEAEFRPTLIKLWKDLSHNYRKQMKRIFYNIRKNREVSFKQQADVQQKFLNFLHRSDDKQEHLNKFVADFNKFSDEFPDLREDEATKDELHQRCDVLSDELWEIVEERKEQNAEERKKIMESGSVENNLDFLTACANQLMQAELDKFKTSIQIIHDYYFAIEEKTTHELTGNITAELAFGDEEAPAVEVLAEGADPLQIQSYTYPRLEKLLQLALRQQVVPDVTKIEAAGGDKKAKAPPPKKGAPAASHEPETAQEESQYVKEMKEAVKVEKSILRFRLVQIRNWTLTRLQDTRQNALNTYKKFDDWIQVAQKAEMDTIEEMCSVIKKAIEEETKIQHELRINFMDFTVDNSTLNYINPPVPKLEALEDRHCDRFTIPQLRTLVSEFEQISASTGDMLQCRELASLLYSKIKNAAHFGGADSTVADCWCDFGLAEINQMLRNLDQKSTGYVNWRVLMTYIILLRSEVANAKEIGRIEKLWESGEVSEEQFCGAEMWFDETESSKDRENAIEFERVKFIKQLLFRTHSSEGVLHVSRLTTVLGQIGQRATEGLTYSQMLFAQVRI